MKKIICIAAACCMLAAGAALVSCDPHKAQCWKMSVTYESGQTEEFYFYGTDVEADAQLEIYHQAGAVKIGREQAFLSEKNCHK